MANAYESLVTKLDIYLNASLTRKSPLPGAAQDPFNLALPGILTLVDGTALDGAADVLWYKRETDVNTAAKDYDLYDLPQDSLGFTIGNGKNVALTRLRLLLVYNWGTNPLLLFNAATNNWTGIVPANATVRIGVGGVVMFAAPKGTPYGSIGPTNKIIRVDKETSYNISFDIVLVGVSANS